MSLYLLPNDFFGTSSLRPTSRCSFQQHPAQAQDSMDIDDLASFLFGGGGVTQRDPFDAVIPQLHQVSRFAHAQAQAQAQARRQREREQREAEQREAALRLRRRRRVAEATHLREAAYFAALMEQRQLELQLQRQQQERRAEAKRVQAKRQKAYEAEIRKALLQRLEVQRQQELEQEQRRRLQEKKQEKEVLLLDEAMQHIFGQFFGGAFEEPRTTQQATKEKANAKETATTQHLPSVPEQNEPIDVDMVDAPAAAPAAPVAASTPKVVEKPVESAPAPAPTNAAISTDDKAAATEHLLFKHPIPAPEGFNISTLSLIVDPATHQVRISGLWPSPPSTAARAASPTPSSHSRTSSASERRGRSPRRSRVADVDENGEEILTPDDEDDFVDLGATAPSDNNKEDHKKDQQQQQSITLALPSDADIDSLRADLTDDGLDVYVKRLGAQL